MTAPAPARRRSLIEDLAIELASIAEETASRPRVKNPWTSLPDYLRNDYRRRAYRLLEVFRRHEQETTR